MSDNLFANLDFDSVPDDPFYIPDNSYLCYVTGVKTGPTKAGDKVGLTITYKIAEGAHEGSEVTEWKQIPQPSNPAHMTSDEARAATWLKQRLLSLGVPKDRLTSFDPDDIVGVKCVVKVVNRGEYRNVQRVEVVDEDFSLEDADTVY